jgi:hypothetical protein
MRLFSEEVIPTLTNANLNIITVKDYTEIFFDVYELEINGKKYIAEKVNTHNGFPVVEIPVVFNNKKTTTTFVLQKGNFEVLYNERNVVYDSIEDGVDSHIDYEKNIVNEIVSAKRENFDQVEIDVVDELVNLKRENFAEEIKEAKDTATHYANSIKREKLAEANKVINNRKKLIDSEIADIKSDLINEFIKVTADLKSNFHQYKLTESENIEELITTSVSDIYKELIDNIDSKSEEAYTQFSEKISKFASDTVSKLISENTEVLSQNANKTISNEITSINNNVSKEISQLRVEVNETVDQHNINLVSLERANVELNDAITRNINKVLSRVGNVKKQIDESIAKEINVIRNNITLAEDRITKFYDVKLENINDRVNLLSEENKQSCIDLITESKNSLLQTISEIKTDIPNIIIESKDGLNKTIDLKKIKTQLEKSITDRFTTEVMSLKRMMEMMSGGGSVAVQFADGGTMNGDLTINGNLYVNSGGTCGVQKAATQNFAIAMAVALA